MPRCVIALGGNIGDVPHTFAQAVHQLRAIPRVRSVTAGGLYQTPAVGGEATAPYVNSAAAIECELAAVELLDLLQSIEQRLGRIRTEHWGPRTLDLDLILFGGEQIHSTRLKVPHPACWYRRFVLDPVCEVAGDVIHPEKQVPFRELRDRLQRRPFRVAIVGGDEAARFDLVESLRAEFTAVEFATPSRESADNDIPAGVPRIELALMAWLGPSAHFPQFEELARLPRLDVTAAPLPPFEFLASVLDSALMEPQRMGDFIDCGDSGGDVARG